MTKKFLITAASLCMAVSLISGCSTKKSEDESKTKIYRRQEIITFEEQAKRLLVDGNKRFVSGNVLGEDISESRRKELSTNGQKPFAVVVCCSDSRVSPEILFDQALGDVFVVRDIGNVVDPVTLGSIEYGVEHLHAPLVVVLGHEKCEVVKAAVDGGEASPNIQSILDKIKPALEKAKKESTSKDELYGKCEDENIKNTVESIKNDEVIKKLEKEKRVTVIGAKYHLDTGEVTFEE